MEHITIDEMLSFLLDKDISPSNIDYIHRFNQHIYKCEDCRKKYTTICDALDDLEVSLKTNSLEVRLLEACLKSEKGSYNDIIKRFVGKIKNLATEITVSVETLSKITTENLLSGFSFYHPAPVGQLKAIGNVEGNNLDILIDDKYNRISVSQDGTLSLRFLKEFCKENQDVFLVPEDENAEVVIAQAQNGPDDFTRVEFYDLSPGKYKIII